MIKVILFALFAALMIALAGCDAQGVNLSAWLETGEKVSGFWHGLWRNLNAPITFIISLVNQNVAMHAVINNGGWYNLGFLLGMNIIFGGSSGGVVARRRHYRVNTPSVSA